MKNSKINPPQFGLIKINLSRSTKIDCRKEENPYKARYTDKWRDVIKRVSSMARFTNVNFLIEYIAGNTRKAGKKHCKECLSFMEQKGYLKMWIRPQLGLSSEEADLRRYQHRPPGNSAELMPFG